MLFLFCRLYDILLQDEVDESWKLFKDWVQIHCDRGIFTNEKHTDSHNHSYQSLCLLI